VPKVFNEFNDELIALLKNGAVGVLPTDTTYGLVCAAGNPEAITRLYTLKSREQKPGTVIAANIDQLVEIGLKARYLKAVEQYWPNPLSIIIPCSPELGHLHLGKLSLAVRIPKDAQIQAFLARTGALLTTSANHPNQKPAENIAEAKGYFGDEVDFYVDGGDLSGREPSTIIRIIDDEVEVLRQGAVKIDEKGAIIT
jgi:L-threonylcarbamoyladenylate synthase